MKKLCLFGATFDIPKQKLTFTGSHADFVEVVKMVKQVGMAPNTDTGNPYTEREQYEKLKDRLEITCLMENLILKS